MTSLFFFIALSRLDPQHLTGAGKDAVVRYVKSSVGPDRKSSRSGQRSRSNPGPRAICLDAYQRTAPIAFEECRDQTVLRYLENVDRAVSSKRDVDDSRESAFVDDGIAALGRNAVDIRVTSWEW